MKKCLIFLEKNYEKFCVDLLKTMEEMFGGNCTSYALSFDSDIAVAKGRFDKIIKVPDENIPVYDVSVLTGIMSEIHRGYQFDCILILATYIGRMLAPAFAANVGTGLVADVTKIGHYRDKIEMIRPAFSGKLLAGIINTTEETVMMSVRPGVFLYEENRNKDTEIRNYTPEAIRCSKIERISRKEKPRSRDIRESEVLVSGGGGILEDFDIIDGLADRLGGMKSASRRVVDSGKADRSIQVGQSGKIVHPKLYVALGICGMLQHVAGLNRVKHIIAVNTNKEAPICSLADIIVEGDASTFVRNIIERIDREK